jgi:hypothetical protein
MESLNRREYLADLGINDNIKMYLKKTGWEGID